MDNFNSLKGDNETFAEHYGCKTTDDILDDVEEVIERMEFPDTIDDFLDEYSFKDTKEVYTNGSELIQVFRVKQWIESHPGCKYWDNNDCSIDLSEYERIKKILNETKSERETIKYLEREIEYLKDIIVKMVAEKYS